jgi:hypothetical protein
VTRGLCVRSGGLDFQFDKLSLDIVEAVPEEKMVIAPSELGGGGNRRQSFIDRSPFPVDDGRGY